MLEFGHGTHVGMRRRCNEDTYYADPERGLFLVADGLGGHRHGELASVLARDAVVTAVGGGAGLEVAIRRADREIVGYRNDAPAEGLPMGTTIAAVRMLGDDFEAAWVGDSRIYLWQDGLRRISRDQTEVEKLVEAGVLDGEQARTHPLRHVVTQALGVTAVDDLRIARVVGHLQTGTQLLLCSDGLTEELDDKRIGAILARTELSAQECVDQLILDALDAGGRDNVSVVLVRVRR